MTRYQLIAPKEEAKATGEIVQVSVAKLLDMGIKKQIDFLLKATAVKGSVKLAAKYQRKYSLVWQNSKTKLYHQQSYFAFISSDGSIRNMAQGSTRVTQENPLAQPKAEATA